jgi:hypothetical protein
MRPAILRDLQRLYDMHDTFKKQLESVSPQSVELWIDGMPLRKSTILQKFQNQSLLTRRRVNSQIGKEGADPSEALLVAKEIDKLVTVIFLNYFFYSSDRDRPPSSISTKLSSDHMMCFLKTSLFYDKATQPTDSGLRALKRCRSLYIQPRRRKRTIRRQ